MTPTVRIKSAHFPAGLVINEADFDPKVHELCEGTAPAAPVAEAPIADAGTGGGQSSEVAGNTDAAIVGVLAQTVGEVKELVAKAESVDWLQAVLAAEQAKQGRKGIVTAIEARLAELAGQGGGQ